MPGNAYDSFDLDSFDFGDFDSLDTGVDVQNQPVPTPEVENIVTSLKKRAMVVFFVIDISGSMRGARIGAVNDAIRNILPELKKREKGNTTAEIKIAVLEFSTRANWRTLSPESVSTFKFQDIDNVGGATNYNTAFSALNEKLSRKQFLNSTAGSYTPLIIFMTDGKPSDMGIYPEELERLKQNRWVQVSTRAGIAIEEGALSPECKRALMEFTENENNVFEAKNTVILAKQIELVTLTGVDFVTKQGSIQTTTPDSKPTETSQENSTHNTDTTNRAPSPEVHYETPSQNSSSSNTSSPTIPMEIDWDKDFEFYDD